jgi:hypothetical protein
MNQLFRHKAWHDVAVFESTEAAKALETFLKDKGFETRTDDDKWFRYFLFLRPPQVVHHVQVYKSRFEEAASLLKKDAPAVLNRAMHCPSCDSLRLNYPQMTRRFILPTILLHAGIILRIVDHECYCEHCHHMWYLPGSKDGSRKVRDVKPFPF